MAVSLDRQVHIAASRITLRVAAEIHTLLGGFQSWLLNEVRRSSPGGIVYAPSLWAKGEAITARWRATTTQWRKVLLAAQDEAALLPFAGLWVRHNQYARHLAEAAADPGVVGQRWLQAHTLIIRGVQARTYGDRLNLSGRVWNLDNRALGDMQNIMRHAFTERTSAADLSRRLEDFLGVNQDLPRWTLARLYRMTPKQRASNLEGLLREPEMRSRGLAYKALRLARTEIAAANHAANDAIAAVSPWVTGKYVRLSPGHPKIDVCDQYASGGPYPINDVILPLHSQCMCYAEYATEPPDVFKRRADAWAVGGDRQVDAYLQWSGLSALEVLPLLPGITDKLDMWLHGSPQTHGRALAVGGVEHPPVQDSAVLHLAANVENPAK